MHSEKHPAEHEAPKSARDEFTTLKGLTMLIGIVLGGTAGAAVGIQTNFVGALVGIMLGAAAGAATSISIWS